MRNVKLFGKKVCAATMAAVMVLSGAISGAGTVAQVQAEDAMEGFVEVAVPNGDFEKGATVWTFAGEIAEDGLAYYYRIFTSEWNDNNNTNTNDNYYCYIH